MVLRLKFCERQWPGRGDPSIQELFPADAVASPRQKKKKKRQDALFLLWEMALCIQKDLLIKLPSPQVSLFHSEERCAVVSRKDPGLSYAKLGESSWQVSPCPFWFSSVSCLGTSTTKEQSVFPGGGGWGWGLGKCHVTSCLVVHWLFVAAKLFWALESLTTQTTCLFGLGICSKHSAASLHEFCESLYSAKTWFCIFCSP